MTMLQSIPRSIQNATKTADIYIHRRKNPAARAARTTVKPDLVTEAALLSERLEELLDPVEVGEGVTVLVLVTPEGPEPEP